VHFYIVRLADLLEVDGEQASNSVSVFVFEPQVLGPRFATLQALVEPSLGGLFAIFSLDMTTLDFGLRVSEQH
jgi:hypothetical protein